jgi:hypothetical protein
MDMGVSTVIASETKQSPATSCPTNDWMAVSLRSSQEDTFEKEVSFRGRTEGIGGVP